MDSKGTYILSKFHGDKLDTDEVSSLSLFLYRTSLIVLAQDDTGEVCAVNLYSFQEFSDLSMIFEEDPLIHSANTFGRLFIHNAQFVLVPQPVFDPTQCEVYLNFHTEVQTATTEVFHLGIHSNTLQVVGCAEKELLSFLDSALPDLEVSSGAAFHLSYLLDTFASSHEEHIFLLPGPGALYVGAFKDSELVLFNYFEIHTENDLMKFLFAVVKQLGFDQRSLHLSVVGDLIHVFSSIDQLIPFFKHIEQLAPIEKLSFRAGAENFQKAGLLEAYWML
ncbi:MAG: DUF3822 family protein [Lunatimonas sp.]|uniref:DUF3822 family protein n=1 Tax=Lunatimonas sp. TaxID=2060141 RepID=UPI00263B734B|nr:DUF3822 family protein [Lunatimonas sp.]MCC5939046.1 DUF3822 family protein [Lunatimonas sp.]